MASGTIVKTGLPCKAMILPDVEFIFDNSTDAKVNVSSISGGIVSAGNLINYTITTVAATTLTNGLSSNGYQIYLTSGTALSQTVHARMILYYT